jgi:hypothetical protein
LMPGVQGLRGTFAKAGEVDPGHLRFTYLVGGSEVSDWQRRADRPGQASVTFQGGHRYPKIAENLAGRGDPQLARDLRRLVQRGTPVTGRQADRLPALAYLMFGRETMRRPDSAAYAAMTVQMIERGEMTFDDAFALHEPGRAEERPGGGGAFPLSRVASDIEPTDRDLRLAAAANPDATREQQSAIAASSAVERETRLREGRLAEQWLIAEARADGEVFDSRAAVESYVRRKLTAFFLGHRSAT